MKLVHKRIPNQFLAHMPPGIKYVKRDDKDFLVVEQLFCPAGHSLMVDSVRLHNEPSINLKMTIGEAEGLVFVDAFWGCHDKLYSFIPSAKDLESETVDVCCPSCATSLIVENAPCRACGSTRFIAMLLPGGKSKIVVCSQLGCPEHSLIAHECAPDVYDEVSNINFFGV